MSDARLWGRASGVLQKESGTIPLSTSAATTATPCRPTARECFELRAWARATLWAAAMLDLHTAVDELQADAERDGLVDELDPDGAQAIIAREFEAVR